MLCVSSTTLTTAHCTHEHNKPRQVGREEVERHPGPGGNHCTRKYICYTERSDIVDLDVMMFSTLYWKHWKL